GADIQVLFQVGAVEHRAAGRALGPQAFRDLLARPADALDLGRQEFLQPAHESSALRMGASSALTRATACSAPAFSISCTIRVPMITASAIFDIASADSASLMPKPTPMGSLETARSLGSWAATSAVSTDLTPV